MKKGIYFILIFVTLVGFLTPHSNIYAQLLPGQGGLGPASGGQGPAPGAATLPPAPTAASNPGASGAAPVLAMAAAQTDDTCGLTNLTGCLMKGVGWIALTIMRLLSLITLLAGALLNFVLLYTVVDMAEHYRDIGAIKISWGMIRDLANMTFIFILLYQAIRTIVGEGKETQKFVVNMIIAALLMNFSFFFTSLVIDASNLITLTFYKAIVSGDVNEANLLQTGLSNAIMKPLNLSSIWNLSDNLSGTNLITIGILGSVFTLIAAFIFFAIALMFIIRYVVLIFVLILSPIFVVGSIIPGMKTYADQWKDALTGQALFAPVYMIITWVVIKIFNSCTFIYGNKMVNGVCTPSTSTLGDALTGSLVEKKNAAGVIIQSAEAGVGNIGLIMNFIVIIAFLIATILIAKKVSDKSGSIVSGMNQWAMKKAGSASFGLVSNVGRSTLGAGFQNIADNEKLKKAAAEGSMSARLALMAANKGAKSSLDLRGSALGGTLGAGSAPSGGYATDKKELEKRYASYKPKVDQVKAAEEAEEQAKKIHDSAVSKAEEKFEAENPASVEYAGAENELRLAEEDAAKPVSTIVDSNGNPYGGTAEEKSRKVAAAKAKFDEQKRLRTESRNNYVAEQSRSTKEAHEKAIERKNNTKVSSMERAARIQEGYKVDQYGNYINKNGEITTNKEEAVKTISGRITSFVSAGGRQAAAIRTASKEKSKREKAKDLLAEAEVEEAAKDKAGSEKPKEEGGSKKEGGDKKTTPES